MHWPPIQKPLRHARIQSPFKISVVNQLQAIQAIQGDDMNNDPLLTFKQYHAASIQSAIDKEEPSMPSIQRDKKDVQSIIDTASAKDLFAIDLNTTSQRSEVMRHIDTALRSKQHVTVAIIKH